MAIGNENAQKTRWLRVVFNGHQIPQWESLRDVLLVVAIGPGTGGGLVTFYHDEVMLVLGVVPDDRIVYKFDPTRDGRQTKVRCRWVWGRATDRYDGCLEYLGLGPLLELCWPSGERPPAPVRALGKACRSACGILDRGLVLLERLCPSSLAARSSLGRVDSWLSVSGVGWLTCVSLDLDPASCGHPRCAGLNVCALAENHRPS